MSPTAAIARYMTGRCEAGNLERNNASRAVSSMACAAVMPKSAKNALATKLPSLGRTLESSLMLERPY